MLFRPVQSSWALLGILTFAFIAFAIETDVYVPSFPDMVKDLGVSESEIQKLLSLNFLGLCLSALLCGPLSDRLGRRPVLVWGTGFFALGSLACFMLREFEALVFSRFLQGLGAGSILAVACTTVFDRYKPEEGASLVGILNSIVTVVMSLAPLMGSWINIQFGWSATFFFIFLMAGFSWLSISFCLPETLPQERRIFRGCLVANPQLA